MESEPLPEAPKFVRGLVEQPVMAEGGNIHLEAQVRSIFSLEKAPLKWEGIKGQKSN